MIFRVIKIHQLTKPNLWSAQRIIRYLLEYMTQLLPSNRLWLCETQKIRADEKIGDLKSADLEITPQKEL